MSTGFESIVLRTVEGATATFHPYGAHLVSWRTADGVERLFTSATAEFRSGAAIRGGVPIIFPQFAGLGPLPKHGFARTATWQRADESAASAVLRLQDDAASRAIWPQRFVAEFRIMLGVNSLDMQLSIHNIDVQPCTFTAALHTYLRVLDIAQVQVNGLQGRHYRDSAANNIDKVESAASLQIEGEVDRIYFSTTQPITVLESGQPSIICTADGFADAVIWNPGATKAASLSDLEPQGYRRMLCVEAAAIGQPIVLQPGASWSGTQHLHVV